MQHLNPDQLAFGVEIDIDVRRDFPGLGDRRAVRGEPCVEGVGGRVIGGLHGRLAPRSKNAVRTRMSAPSGRCATRNIRPWASEMARKARVTKGSSGSGAVQSGAVMVASTQVRRIWRSVSRRIA